MVRLPRRAKRTDTLFPYTTRFRALQDRHFVRVFNVLHGGDGESGVLQGLLESLRVPYTGSGVLGSALSLGKIRAKQVLAAEGLPTPRWIRLAKGDDPASGAGPAVHAAARELGLPVIIKQSLEGSSVGVSRVFGEADLDIGRASCRERVRQYV